MPKDQRWDGELLHKMEGTTSQPVPGHKSDHVPVEIDNEGVPSGRSQEDDDAVESKPIPIEVGATEMVRIRASKVTDIRVTEKDTAKHGATPGCPACGYVVENKKIPR